MFEVLQFMLLRQSLCLTVKSLMVVLPWCSNLKVHYLFTIEAFYPHGGTVVYTNFSWHPMCYKIMHTDSYLNTAVCEDVYYISDRCVLLLLDGAPLFYNLLYMTSHMLDKAEAGLPTSSDGL